METVILLFKSSISVLKSFLLIFSGTLSKRTEEIVDLAREVAEFRLPPNHGAAGAVSSNTL